MNSNNLFQFLQQGFHVTIGATATLMETVRDPQKREAALSHLQTELSVRTREWAEKGKVTEQEARKMLEQLLRQRNGGKESGSNTPSTSTATTQDTTAVVSELRELTEEIISLRKELESD